MTVALFDLAARSVRRYAPRADSSHQPTVDGRMYVHTSTSPCPAGRQPGRRQAGSRQLAACSPSSSVSTLWADCTLEEVCTCIRSHTEGTVSLFHALIRTYGLLHNAELPWASPAGTPAVTRRPRQYCSSRSRLDLQPWVGWLQF